MLSTSRIVTRIAVLSLLLLSSAAYALSFSGPLQVAVPTAGLSDAPSPLIGFIFEPEGKGPHPAVVMVHGCGGAYAKNGALNARHQMWGDYLAQQGYLVLMLDSLGSRGLKELCTVKLSDRTLKETDRVGDAYAALTYMRSRQDVDAKRIGLLGWSHGGGVTLRTITRPPKTGDGFRAAVSFYPGCVTLNKKPQDFHPYAPLLVLIGESDDWTPAAPCKELTAKVAARGEPMSIVTYPDTYHDFDNPELKKKHVRKEVPNGVNPGQGVTTAPNPVAREDAKQRVRVFFAEKLK